MIGRTILGSALVLVLASPALAGPCSQRLAELEKAITARQEGAGPVLADPNATGSTTQPSSGTNVTAQAADANRSMQMIQEAKQLDQQGKEAECMEKANQVSAIAPPAMK
jgi:hypothetical protein